MAKSVGEPAAGRGGSSRPWLSTSDGFDIVGGEELLQVPSVSIALRDADGRVLLARHSEGGVWLLPVAP